MTKTTKTTGSFSVAWDHKSGACVSFTKVPSNSQDPSFIGLQYVPGGICRLMREETLESTWEDASLHYSHAWWGVHFQLLDHISLHSSSLYLTTKITLHSWKSFKWKEKLLQNKCWIQSLTSPEVYYKCFIKLWMQYFKWPGSGQKWCLEGIFVLNESITLNPQNMRSMLY